MNTLTAAHIAAYIQSLRAQERAPATVEKYLREVRFFAAWLDGRPVTQERTAAWKACLLERGCAPATVNVKLSALNGLLRFLGWEKCRVKPLRLQHRLFRDARRDLDRAEYRRLLETAVGQGRERLALLLQTICAAGIRVSELRYITVETVAPAGPMWHSRGKSAPSSCPAGSAVNCSSSLRNKKSSPARFFSPKTENPSPATRSGGK